MFSPVSLDFGRPTHQAQWEFSSANDRTIFPWMGIWTYPKVYNELGFGSLRKIALYHLYFQKKVIDIDRDFKELWKKWMDCALFPYLKDHKVLPLINSANTASNAINARGSWYKTLSLWRLPWQTVILNRPKDWCRKPVSCYTTCKNTWGNNQNTKFIKWVSRV